MSSAEILGQRLPAQDLGRLTLVGHQPRKLAEWVSALPMINVGETSRQVFQTLQELNRLKLDYPARLELLEILRPVAHSLVDALSKHYLNQSVMLPERATKVATLAQAMQAHLATGYKIIALEAMAKLNPAKRDPEVAKVAARAIHRAITELSGNLLRSTQLYLNTPPRLWLELHALYLCASDLGLAIDPKIDDAVVQRQASVTSVEDTYKRALLLATCKANKLRQSEIAQIFQLGEVWAPLVNLNEFSGSGELFVFDLSKDAPPTYRTQAKADDAYHVRGIDPSLLVHRLNELKRDNQTHGPRGRGETALSLSLLQHLVQAWSELTERSFSRVAHDGTLEACLGLTALHYFLAGREFESLMRGEQGRYLQGQEHNPFMKRAPAHREDERSGKDVWAMAFGTVESTGDASKPVEFSNLKFQEEQAAQADAPPKYDTHVCQIVNISPGGYCIQWAGEPPSGVRAGEILGLREDGQTSWSIGVIRWVKQLPGQGAQLGIEVLAPKAKPCGARVIKKTGEATEYMRTLLLPELKAIGRPATLITPALTFRPGYKVGLNLDGEEVKAHLTQQLSATPSFCQFEFNLLRKTGLALEDNESLGGTDEDFDAIWSSL